MQARMFETKILQDGIIQIPELSNWSDFEVSIIVVRKSGKKVKQNNNIEAKQYNSRKILADFHRIRQMKTGQTEIFTMNN